MSLAKPDQVLKPEKLRFSLHGEVTPLAKAAAPEGYQPRRALGGWLATYATIGANGGLVPTEDREGHIFEAAKAIGMIDFTAYLRKGIWNDTHEPIYIGVPTGLEFHDEHSELAKAHRKVGFWTEGHLFDRNDPRSWSQFTKYEPTSKDLERADYYWTLATMLKGLPRPLGFSAHGDMILSKCKRRIIWASVAENAVCELPQNPYATAHPLRLAVSQPIRADMIGTNPCATCSCPPGARCPVRPLAKAGGVTHTTPTSQDLEPASTGDSTSELTENEREEALVQLLVDYHHVSEAQARRWVRTYLVQQETR